VPRAAAVPEYDDRELEPLGLVHREDLHGLAEDRVRRIQLDGLVNPLAEPRGRGVVIEALGCGKLLDDQAHFPQAGQTLGAVRAEGNRPAEAGQLEEIAGRGAGAPVVAGGGPAAAAVPRPLPAPAGARAP